MRSKASFDIDLFHSVPLMAASIFFLSACEHKDLLMEESAKGWLQLLRCHGALRNSPSEAVTVSPLLMRQSSSSTSIPTSCRCRALKVARWVSVSVKQSNSDC